MKNEEITYYHKNLKKSIFMLFFKKIFDLFFSILLCFLLLPVMLIIAILIKLDSEGPVFFRQERITKNKKRFKILKFRTMTKSFSEDSSVTEYKDPRITYVGKYLRNFHLDEIPQLFNIITGNMTFVGTRPELAKYVSKYTNKMNATFLLPAGLTSLASIKFKDESIFFKNTKNIDQIYLEKILPQKMEYNLYYLENFSLWLDAKIIFKTLFSVFF
ncbi:MAG: sugar transferase [Oscillospiraceae bacterium]|jgi:lipopolysaccharide/colanic/teichoic acid biosynthesis glycosyltransferase|nr:sugar transferase [Oscillospiraceae bacterium]